MWFEGGFAKRVQLLGVLFVLDANPKYCEVPGDKVARTLALLRLSMSEQWIPADHGMTLLGLLVFHGRVLLSGKWHLPFTVRGSAVACQHGVAPMTTEWRVELQWWATLLQDWNRVAIIVPRTFRTWHQEPYCTPMTDASRSKQRRRGAAGAMFENLFQAWEFTSQEVDNLHIMELEGVALVVWIHTLCDRPEARAKIEGRRFLMLCDNEPFVKAVNRRHSTYPSVAFLLGELHLLMAKHSFDLRLEYIQSKLNVGADALSRNRPDQYYAYMQSQFNVSTASLVHVPLQIAYRNSVTSTMMSLGRSARRTQNRRKDGGRHPRDGGSSSANGRAAR